MFTFGNIQSKFGSCKSIINWLVLPQAFVYHHWQLIHNYLFQTTSSSQSKIKSVNQLATKTINLNLILLVTISSQIPHISSNMQPINPTHQLEKIS